MNRKQRFSCPHGCTRVSDYVFGVLRAMHDRDCHLHLDMSNDTPWNTYRLYTSDGLMYQRRVRISTVNRLSARGLVAYDHSRGGHTLTTGGRVVARTGLDVLGLAQVLGEQVLELLLSSRTPASAVQSLARLARDPQGREKLDQFLAKRSASASSPHPTSGCDQPSQAASAGDPQARASAGSRRAT